HTLGRNFAHSAASTPPLRIGTSIDSPVRLSVIVMLSVNELSHSGSNAHPSVARINQQRRVDADAVAMRSPLIDRSGPPVVRLAGARRLAQPTSARGRWLPLRSRWPR